jgi:hypothetical protein
LAVLQGKGLCGKEAFLLTAVWLLCGLKVTALPRQLSGLVLYLKPGNFVPQITVKRSPEIINVGGVFIGNAPPFKYSIPQHIPKLLPLNKLTVYE